MTMRTAGHRPEELDLKPPPTITGDVPPARSVATLISNGQDVLLAPEVDMKVIDRIGQDLREVEAAADDEGHDFDWVENADIVVQEQRATAVYINPKGHVVIRQERSWCEEEDPFIVIKPENLMPLIDRLCEIAGIGSAP
jgi:hypothetical protein